MSQSVCIWLRRPTAPSSPGFSILPLNSILFFPTLNRLLFPRVPSILNYSNNKLFEFKANAKIMTLINEFFSPIFSYNFVTSDLFYFMHVLFMIYVTFLMFLESFLVFAMGIKTAVRVKVKIRKISRTTTKQRKTFFKK